MRHVVVIALRAVPRRGRPSRPHARRVCGGRGGARRCRLDQEALKLIGNEGTASLSTVDIATVIDVNDRQYPVLLVDPAGDLVSAV